MLVRAAEVDPDGVRRPRLPRRARAGRSTGRRGAVCGVRLPAGSASSRSGCPSRSSRRRPRRRRATTCRSRPSEAGELVGAGLSERLRELTLGTVRADRRSARLERGDHPGRHEVRVRVRRTASSSSIDEVRHARLVAVLAGRRVRAGRRPALVRQAVRARLARRERLGPRAAAARAARRRGRARRPRSTARRTSGSAGETFDAYLGGWARRGDGRSRSRCWSR